MKSPNCPARPNLYFDGHTAVIDWFTEGVKRRWIGPQALVIRDNGTATAIPVTKLNASDFIFTVGTYNYRATKEEVMEDLTLFWMRTLGER